MAPDVWRTIHGSACEQTHRGLWFDVTSRFRSSLRCSGPWLRLIATGGLCELLTIEICTDVPSSGRRRPGCAPRCHTAVSTTTNAGFLGSATLAVRISKELDRDIIHPLGRLDAGNRNLLFCHCLAAGKHHVVIDMTYVSEIDHEALAGIHAARHVLESECGSLSIRHASGQPAQVLTHDTDSVHIPDQSGSTTWL